MGKDKYKRFLECKEFECMIEPDFDEIFGKDHKIKGRWRDDFFKNNNPIVLELGCGRGEYTVGLARRNPNINYIGVDIKGARMWRGAKTATEEKLTNVGFLRTRIEFITSFFAENEIDGIWITFADPQLKKNRANKRLTSPNFLTLYSNFLKDSALINLKTDSDHLHLYTREVIRANNLTEYSCNMDIYKDGAGLSPEVTSIKTTYEERFLNDGDSITYLQFSLLGKKEFLPVEFDADDSL